MKTKYDFLIGISLYNTDTFLENQIVNLKRCIEYSGLNVKIKYFDDGSNSDKAKFMKGICSDYSVDYHRYNHMGFGAICDEIGQESEIAENCLILDSDVFLPDYFLSHAYQIMYFRDEMCGVFSYKSIRIGFQDCYSLNIPNIQVFNHDAYNGGFTKPEPTTELATYTFLMDFSDYVAAGGFNRRYQAYYSDSDFCCRMARAGFINYRLHFPKVFHVEHGTLQDPVNSFDVDKLRESDLKIFTDYWKRNPQEIEKYFQEKWLCSKYLSA